MSEMLDRVPPHDFSAERAVLGSILLSPPLIDDLITEVEPEHFYSQEHQTLFASMRALYQEQARLDLLLLVNRLKRDGQYEEIGGAAKLAKISQETPIAYNAAYYARIVRGKALLRALLTGAQDTLIDAYNSAGLEPEQVLEFAERRFTQLSLWRVSSDNQPRSIQHVMHDARERIEARLRGDFDAGIPSPFDQLDGKTGGWQRANLIVIGGRPGNGKTALGLQLAYHAAHHGHPVLFFSLEMTHQELAERLLAQRTRIDGYRLRNATRLRDDERHLIEQVAGDLAQLPMAIQDDPTRTVTMITSESRRQARSDQGLGAIVIDYLQLITPETRRGEKPSRQEQVAQMSRQLKHLAKELNVPVIVLAQVNRQSAKEVRAPRLNELRESGAIEQDADMVVFVHRPKVESDQDTTGPNDNPDGTENAILALAKNRMGPVGNVPVTFHNPTASFAPPATAQQEQAEWHDLAEF